jgi:hypothetical protein
MRKHEEDFPNRNCVYIQSILLLPRLSYLFLPHNLLCFWKLGGYRHDLLCIATTRAIPNKRHLNRSGKIELWDDLSFGSGDKVYRRLIDRTMFS